MSVEKVIDLDAIRARLDKKVWTPGVAMEQACREDIADLLVLLDEARAALHELDDAWMGIAGLAMTGRDDRELARLRDRRGELLARFPTPSPSEEES